MRNRLAWLLAALLVVAPLRVYPDPIGSPPGSAGAPGAPDTEWTDTGATVHLNETGDEVVFGATSPLGGAKVSIDGDADQIQLSVQGFSTQTSLLARIADSADTLQFHVTNVGNVYARGTLGLKDTATCADPVSGDTSVCFNTGRIQVRDTGGSTLVVPTTSDILGKRTIWVPARSMDADLTVGPSDPGLVQPTPGSGVYHPKDFDTSTAERAYFDFFGPKSWDAGAIQYTVPWTADSPSTNGVAWGLKCRANADAVTIPSAYGTQVVITDAHAGVAHRMNQPALSGNLTVASAAANTLVSCELERVVSNGSDTLAVDARAIGVEITYTINALTDN